MAEITNEQEIWGILHDHVSPDDVWKEGVAELLVKSEYLNRGYAFSNQESRVVYSVTKQGRSQIPILWNGSTLKKEHDGEVKALKDESSFEVRHKKINKFLWILLTAIVSSLVTIIVSKLLSLLCKK